jgi:outer membrane protein OmpA-like peptidoglycan-associated protein
MKKHLISFLLIICSTYTMSQQDFVMYNMQFVPQRTYTNVANLPASKVNIGLPIISSMYFNVGNSGFKYTDLIRKRHDDSLYIDTENMLSKLNPNNYLTGSVQSDLISVGFKVKEKNYISINITEKVHTRFRYPKDLIEFAWRGNGALLDRELHFNLGFNMMHYTEYGASFTRQINDKLSIGGRLKYLNGKENIWTEKFDVRLTTESKHFAITAQSDILINTAGVADTTAFQNFSPTKYMFKRSNNGAGADLGANYKLNDKFSFSASVNDIGFISWNAHVRNYRSKNPGATFTYEGVDIVKFFNDSTSIDKAFENTIDSISGTFAIEETSNSYRTWLTPQIYLGGNYQINEKSDVGLLFYGQIFDKALRPGVSLSYNARLGNVFSASAAYSIYNRSYTNLGLGISLNLGPLQWYIMTDNIVGFIVPQSSKLSHVHAGFNLTFGRKEKDSDKDGIPDKKDECPYDKGPAEFNGCPDSDGDKIIDRYDECPFVPGLPEFKGCPDKDGDGIPDKNDDCPEEAGLAELNGCPDKDEDGIADKDDECPEVPGLAELKGCPDKDGDGITDSKDECPDVPGLAELNGCPDKDGDGVPDHKDACPDKPGPASNDGCPEIKLKLVDKDGNVLKVSIQNRDGIFVFDELPSDESAMFIIEGEDTENMRIVKVMGANGVVKNAIKDDKGNIYRFVVLKPELNKMQKEEAKDVVIKLNKEEEEILKKAFDNLEFATAKDIIKENSLGSLDELASLMQKKPSWRLKISGHTDNQGKAASNMILSKKRAEAVKKYLMNKGIAEDRFKVEWFGQTKPIADNRNEQGRQKNRRVEMLIIE